MFSEEADLCLLASVLPAGRRSSSRPRPSFTAGEPRRVSNPVLMYQELPSNSSRCSASTARRRGRRVPSVLRQGCRLQCSSTAARRMAAHNAAARRAFRTARPVVPRADGSRTEALDRQSKASAPSTDPAYLVELLQPRTTRRNRIVVVSAPLGAAGQPSARRGGTRFRPRRTGLPSSAADAPSHLSFPFVPAQFDTPRAGFGRPAHRPPWSRRSRLARCPERLLPKSAYVAPSAGSAGLADAVPLRSVEWARRGRRPQIGRRLRGNTAGARRQGRDGREDSREERALATVAPPRRARASSARSEGVVPRGDRARSSSVRSKGSAPPRVWRSPRGGWSRCSNGSLRWLEAWAARRGRPGVGTRRLDAACTRGPRARRVVERAISTGSPGGPGGLPHAASTHGRP
jgi:hypothetical protein